MTTPELLSVLREMIQEFTNVFVIVEGLDEGIYQDTIAELMLLLDTMAQWKPPRLHLLMSSRNVDQIRDILTTFLSEDAMLCLDYEKLSKSGKDNFDKAYCARRERAAKKVKCVYGSGDFHR